MSRWRSKVDRVLCVAGATVFALAPKCVVCLAAYAGIGAWLGVRWGVPTVCGEHPASIAPALVGLALLGAGAGVFVFRHWPPRSFRGGRRSRGGGVDQPDGINPTGS